MLSLNVSPMLDTASRLKGPTASNGVIIVFAYSLLLNQVLKLRDSKNCTNFLNASCSTVRGVSRELNAEVGKEAAAAEVRYDLNFELLVAVAEFRSSKSVFNLCKSPAARKSTIDMSDLLNPPPPLSESALSSLTANPTGVLIC